MVINLSNQSDASDLLGGFKPVQASAALAPLAAQFDQLMRGTWPQVRVPVSQRTYCPVRLCVNTK